MYVDLKELNVFDLYGIAMYMDSVKRLDKFPVNGNHPNDFVWVRSILNRWNWEYTLQTRKGCRYGDPNGTCIIVTGPGMVFNSGYEYVRHNIGWMDVARAVLAAEYRGFWADLPDELCVKLNL